MSRMKDLVYEIQRAIEDGELTFRQIAQKFEVSVGDVNEVANELAGQYGDDDYYQPSANFRD